MLFLARWVRRLSWKSNAEGFRPSWAKVFDAVEHVVTRGLEHRALGQIDAAPHIVDRFHIVSHMNKAVSRAEETGRIKREGPGLVLKKSRWLLLKRSENPKDERRFRLCDLLRYSAIVFYWEL
jgi:transposase